MAITSIKYSKILITALVVFCMVKAINGISKKLVKTEDDGAEPTTKQCKKPHCSSKFNRCCNAVFMIFGKATSDSITGYSSCTAHTPN